MIPSLNSAVSSARSGLAAQQRALDISANNTANATTNGFAPSRPNFVEQSGGGVSVSASPSTKVTLSSAALTTSGAVSTQPSGTDLATERVNSMTYGYAFDAAAKAIQSANDRMGTLLNTAA